jgi:FkbM family methyltransferase
MSRHEVDAREFCSDFIGAPANLRFVFGTGDYGRSIADVVEIAAFVDDFTDATHIDATPIFRTKEVPSEGLVVVASMLRPRTALEAVKDCGLRALDYFAFARFSGLPVRPVTFWPEFEADFERHRDKYLAVRARLADQESVDLFDNLVRFRTEADLDSMAKYEFDQVNQYFEPFLELQISGETFVDVGSFDGQTSLEFAARAPEFAHIYAFEPSEINRRSVEANLAGLGAERATVFPFCLGDHETTLKFDSQLGSSSRASSKGDVDISVRTLDSLDIRNPTMIKMDIEGAEGPALLGALQTIRTHHPRLAISVYHRFDDLWRIPAVIDEAGVPYRLHLRHYTEGIDETVMFFMPEELPSSDG